MSVMSIALWDGLWSTVPSGSGSGSSTFTAAENIGGQRFVKLNALGEVALADSGTLTDKDKVIGITETAVTVGNTVEVLFLGNLKDAAFSFTAGGTLFLGSSGVITQTSPTSGFIVKGGYAAASDEVFISVQQPIVLI